MNCLRRVVLSERFEIASHTSVAVYSMKSLITVTELNSFLGFYIVFLNTPPNLLASRRLSANVSEKTSEEGLDSSLRKRIQPSKPYRTN